MSETNDNKASVKVSNLLVTPRYDSDGECILCGGVNNCKNNCATREILTIVRALEKERDELRVSVANFRQIAANELIEHIELREQVHKSCDNLEKQLDKLKEELRKNEQETNGLREKLAARDAEIERLKAWITDNTGFQDWGSLISTKESTK